MRKTRDHSREILEALGVLRRQAPEHQELPILDHVVQDMLNRLATDGGPPVYTLTPAEARSALLRTQSVPVLRPDAQVNDQIVNTGTLVLRLRTIRPPFTEAADESGMSRRYAGLHFEDADLEGRALGRRVAALSWNKAQEYVSGSQAAKREPVHVTKRN